MRSHTLELDGDGKADILWKHTDGRVFVWLMNGTSVTSAGFLPTESNLAWKIVGL